MRFSIRDLLPVVLLSSAIQGNCEDSKRRDLDLANHAPFAAAIGALNSVTLYEGLPGETKLLASELKTKKTVKFHEYPFYSETLPVSEADAGTFTKICAERGSIAKYEGNLCGGFHPDYCLEWKVGKETWQALICLGCGEVKFYGPKNMRLHCNLEKETYKKLQAMFKGYRKNRPVGNVKAAP